MSSLPSAHSERRASNANNVSGHLERRATSQFFYARVTVGGKRKTVPLGVPVRGVPPRSLAQRGNREFEVSRAEAAVTLDGLLVHLRTGKSLESWISRGASKPALILDDVLSKWKSTFPVGQAFKRPPVQDRTPEDMVPIQSGEERLSPAYLAQVVTWTIRLVKWAKDQKLEYVEQITEALERAFLSHSSRHERLTKKSLENVVIMLRGVFTRLAQSGYPCPRLFSKVPLTRDFDTASKTALTEEQQSLLLREAVERKLEIAPVIVIATCTGARKINTCLLQWENVDLAQKVLHIRPAKKGKPVDIPMLPPVQQILEDAAAAAGEKRSGWVWPSLAERYSRAPDSILADFRNLLRDIGVDPTTFHGERHNRRRRPSLIDIAALRTTFVTQAQAAAITPQDIAKITGQKTLSLVVSDYYQPKLKRLRDGLERMYATIKPEGLKSLSQPAEQAKADPLAAFVGTLDVCNPTNIDAAKAVLFTLAEKLVLPDPARANVVLAVNRLSAGNLDVSRRAVLAELDRAR